MSAINRNTPIQPTTADAPSAPAETPQAPDAAAPTAAPRNTSMPGRMGAIASVSGAHKALDAAATSAAAAMAASAGKPTAFALIPGRYPDCVGLPDVLAAMPKGAQAQAAVGKIVAQLEASTGVKLPPAVVAAAVADPAKLADLLAVTPAGLSAGVDAMNAAHQSGARRVEVPPKPKTLPQGFDFANLSKIAYKRPEPQMKEIAPGLYQGDLKSDIPDSQAKLNTLVAEGLDRLAGNADLPENQRFKLKYNGGEYSRLDTFLDALKKDGYTVECEFSHRVANFANLKAKGPDGKFRDVPAALNLKTGVKGPDGKEAVVPAVHSEMIVRIKSGPETKGPKIDSNVKWYQGISGTGFFPCDLNATPAWCGDSTSGKLTGKAALDAVKTAGALGDVINSSAGKLGLAMGGYGATGVCNDSVAVVQHAVTGKTDIYPLVMRDSILMNDIERRLGDANRRDDPVYKKLAKSIDAVPSDVQPNPSAKARAAASIPWKAGSEPFQAVVDARKILGGGK